MKNFLVVALLFLTGCAGAAEMLGTKKLDVPLEFNQKILLDVSDSYQQFQTTRSQYDVGDLQSFHTQQTLPVVVEGAFREMFGQVELLKKEAAIETEPPEVPAIFEVRVIDLANDVYFESADTYRSQLTLAVAMKSPRGNVFWQQSFRGEGYAKVDPQFSTGLGPQDAVIDAMHDALTQMQKAITSSPEIRLQMKHYQEIDQARRQKEVGV